LQQRDAFAGGAAALAFRSHVLAQPLAGGEVLIPADIAGMVLGQADGPLLQRQIDGSAPNPPGLVQRLLLASATKYERAGIGGIGQERVH
jgi:hypothetical protein